MQLKPEYTSALGRSQVGQKMSPSRGSLTLCLFKCSRIHILVTYLHLSDVYLSTYAARQDPCLSRMPERRSLHGRLHPMLVI